MLRKIRIMTPLLMLALLIVPAASAQMISYADQVRLVAPSTSGEIGLFTTITGDTLRQGDWSFSIYYNNYDYLAAPAPEFRPPSRRDYRDMDLEDSRVSLSLGYGLTDRWEIVASIPYIMLENNANDAAGFVNGHLAVGEFDESGIGNLHIGTKFGLTPLDSANRVALSLFYDLPTGDDVVTSGEGDFGVGIHWTRGIGTLAATYRLTGDPGDDDDFDPDFTTDVANSLQIDGGLNVPLSFWETTNWISEVNAILYQGADREPDDAIYLMTGLRHWFGTSGWSLSAGVRLNASMMGSDNGSCPWGGILGLGFAPMHLTPVAAPPPPPPPVAPPPPPVAPPPPPVAPPPQPQVIRTDEIHFEAGSARLTNIAKAILDDVALRMKQEPRANAIVIGYTDDREATGPNADLDRRRAEAVRDYLVSRHGIDPSRIRIEARGTQDPVGDNTTAEGRLRNRRVVIRLQTD
ncbi:MAG TPA: OmpA family protein [Thermoanaerobaculia bacterium]|nr:OmpA family protein [Thermoanaerobaculia bacterium]